MIRRHGRAFLERYGERVTPQQRKVLAATAACRTATMGGHLHRCNDCGSEINMYNSCNDRHCPLCQGGRRADWLRRQQDDLLPVAYYHATFTVPDRLDVIAVAHPKEFYELLLRAVRETLLEIAASPEHLGADIGGVMVLHSWGQAMGIHPHVHVILPGGGLSSDGPRWISCPRAFFLPEAVLGRKFRGKLLALLKESHAAGRLPMSGEQAYLDEPRSFHRFLSPLYEIDWVVDIEPPEAGPEVVLKYLARYTYRVAISNDRIQSISDDQVIFRYKDYSRGGLWDSMSLDGVEFLRRFSLHILPKGFVRVRSFGFLANRHRKQKLALIRRLLAGADQEDERAADADSPSERGGAEPVQLPEPPRCPHCKKGFVLPAGRLPRPTVAELVARTYTPCPFDTS